MLTKYNIYFANFRVRFEKSFYDAVVNAAASFFRNRRFYRIVSIKNAFLIFFKAGKIYE